MPPGTRIVADNFKIGAELGFALGDPRIPVLDHPLNRKHGRAPQLRLWGLQYADRAEAGRCARAARRRRVAMSNTATCCVVTTRCATSSARLPPPRVLNIDHGRQRFLLFALRGAEQGEPCTTPAMAWIDTPVSGARVGRKFEVGGWAFKDGVGLARVDVTARRPAWSSEPTTACRVRGRPAFWQISTDPQHPDVGFRADDRLPATSRRVAHWLGLRLHGRDGSVETWPRAAGDDRRRLIGARTQASGQRESGLAQQPRRRDQRQADQRRRDRAIRSRRTARCPGPRT